MRRKLQPEEKREIEARLLKEAKEARSSIEVEVEVNEYIYANGEPRFRILSKPKGSSGGAA